MIHTQHQIKTPCRTSSTTAPRPHIERVPQTDPSISSLACATSVSTYAPATAQILSRVEFALSLSSCACSVQSRKQPSLPVSYDQLQTVHSPRIHCIGGCIADVYNLQTNHTKLLHAVHDISCRTLHKLGANPSSGQRNNHVKHKLATRMPYEIRAPMQKTMLVKHTILETCARAIGDNTSVQRKTNKETLKKKRKRNDTCRWLIVWVLTETN